MKRLQRELSQVIARDPDVATFGSFFGSGRQHAQHRALLHRPQAARRAQIDGARGDRPAAAAARRGRGRQSVPAAIAGHQRRRPHLARPVPIHAAGRRLDELNAWAPRMLAKLKTLPELTDVSSDQQGNAPRLTRHHQPRRRRALRHPAAGDRRHARRRIRTAPGRAVFHADQLLLHRARSAAGSAEESRRRSTRST